MALLTFEMQTTTGTNSGGNGFGNIRAGNQHQDKLEKQREAIGSPTGSDGFRHFGWKPSLGEARWAAAGNGFGNAQSGDHYWDEL